MVDTAVSLIEDHLEMELVRVLTAIRLVLGLDLVAACTHLLSWVVD
jgi:hypothetical protein